MGQLISELRDDISEAGRELRNRSAWDLQCPVVIIDARTEPNRVVRTSVRGITGAIATSNVIDDPLMRSFLQRFREVGADEALNEFLQGPEAERFSELWDIYNDEAQQQGLAVWSTVTPPNLCSSRKLVLTMVSWPVLPLRRETIVMPTT